MKNYSYYHQYENPTQLSARQLWLLGTSAMTAQLNKQRHDTLHPYHTAVTPSQVESGKLCLKRDWDIENLEGLSETLKYLYEEKTYKGVEENWEMLSHQELVASGRFGEELKEYRNVMDMLRHYQFGLPSSDYAWHYGRSSWVIREAYLCGYITEEEAWGLLEENGRRIKDSFASWESFGLSYVVGAQYWKRNQYTEASVSRYYDHLTFLLTNKHSPWIRIAWDDFE